MHTDAQQGYDLRQYGWEHLMYLIEQCAENRTDRCLRCDYQGDCLILWGKADEMRLSDERRHPSERKEATDDAH